MLKTEIKGSKCIVTGGAGFVGSNLTRRLLYENASEVVVLDNFLRGRKQNLESIVGDRRLKVISGTIEDRKLVTSICDGSDFIFHNAVLRLPFAEENPELCRTVMLDGSINLIEAAISNRIPKFIFSSSATVYGEPNYLPIDENHPLKTETHYGNAKIKIENHLASLGENIGFDYAILRYFNIYGPRADFYSQYTEVIPRWIVNLDRGLQPEIYGNFEHCYDFTHVTDIVDANILAATSQTRNKVFNIGTGVTTSLEELAELMLDLYGVKLKLRYGEPENRPIVRKRVADISRACQELHFTARINLVDGLKNTIEWWNMEGKMDE